MKKIVKSGERPGIIAYENEKPIGWRSIAPREKFHSLNRSPVLKKIDDTHVWSIVCFFVAKDYQNKGMTLILINAAIDYVRQNDGKKKGNWRLRDAGRISSQSNRDDDM